MALAVTASSLRGEFSSSGFGCSSSSQKRNSYKAKKHRTGQSKQPPGGGGGNASGAQGTSPQVSAGKMVGKALGTGQTTSAGSTVIQPPPALDPSRPAQHKLVLLLYHNQHLCWIEGSTIESRDFLLSFFSCSRRYQRKTQQKSEPNSKTNRWISAWCYYRLVSAHTKALKLLAPYIIIYWVTINLLRVYFYFWNSFPPAFVTMSMVTSHSLPTGFTCSQ